MHIHFDGASTSSMSTSQCSHDLHTLCSCKLSKVSLFSMFFTSTFNITSIVVLALMSNQRFLTLHFGSHERHSFRLDKCYSLSQDATTQIIMVMIIMVTIAGRIVLVVTQRMRPQQRHKILLGTFALTGREQQHVSTSEYIYYTHSLRQGDCHICFERAKVSESWMREANCMRNKCSVARPECAQSFCLGEYMQGVNV